jgi:hypothetical protein
MRIYNTKTFTFSFLILQIFTAIVIFANNSLAAECANLFDNNYSHNYLQAKAHGEATTINYMFRMKDLSAQISDDGLVRIAGTKEAIQLKLNPIYGFQLYQARDKNLYLVAKNNKDVEIIQVEESKLTRIDPDLAPYEIQTFIGRKQMFSWNTNVEVKPFPSPVRIDAQSGAISVSRQHMGDQVGELIISRVQLVKKPFNFLNLFRGYDRKYYYEEVDQLMKTDEVRSLIKLLRTMLPNVEVEPGPFDFYNATFKEQILIYGKELPDNLLEILSSSDPEIRIQWTIRNRSALVLKF